MWPCHAATILWWVGSIVSQLYVVPCHKQGLYIMTLFVMLLITKLYIN